MVMVAVLFLMVAFCGFDSMIWNVSLGSLSVVVFDCD